MAIAHSIKEGVVGAFVEAEQEGLRLALKGRFLFLVILAIWFVVSRPLPVAINLLALVGVLGILGLAQAATLGGRHDRAWLRYFFIAFDIMIIAVAMVFAPISTSGEVPQIFAFRSDVFPYFFFILAVAALSLSPGLVLWAGVTIAACWWGVFAWITMGMERTVTWNDLPDDPSLEQYLAVVFDPDFIGTGSRVQETVALLATALVLSLAVRRARGVVGAFAQAERARLSVEEMFGQYVPEDVARHLVQGGGVLPPQEREATVLFVDLEGFTALAERMTPEQVVALLNGYFDAVSVAVSRHGGAVIQFQGDGVLAAFNAPAEDPDHAANALRAASAILKGLDKLDTQGRKLKVRIGLCTGPVAVGTVGGGGRQSFTVLGDTVNLTARLEVLNKDYGTTVLLSESTAAAAGAAIDLKPIGTVEVRGKSEPVSIFTLASGAT